MSLKLMAAKSAEEMVNPLVFLSAYIPTDCICICYHFAQLENVTQVEKQA
jgi:hypothetical protein